MAVELGGKNPHIVFADVGRATGTARSTRCSPGVFLHSGQVCSAGTRLIVEESIADDFVADAGRARGEDPDGRRHGSGQRDRAAGLRAAPRQGRSPCRSRASPRARSWSPAAPGPPTRRWPTAVSTCPRSSTGATGRCESSQEETFGPILTVERFTTEAEAIELGNDTEYGLAAGVRTSDQARGERVVRALRHGTVWLNDFGYYTAAAEWGGFGKSGNGRELGPTGLAEYQEIKHIWHNTAPKPAGWFKGSQRRTYRHGRSRSRTPTAAWRTSATRNRSTAASASSPASPPASATSRSSPAPSSCSTSASAPRGPAYLWSWPMVFVGQMAVALCFMELAAKYPVAGSVYNWSQEAGQPARRLVVGLADAHRVDRHALGGGAGAAAQPAAAVERLPDRRRRHRRPTTSPPTR